MTMAYDPAQLEGSKEDGQAATPNVPCRPADLANLLLAGPGLRSRQRARDQQADKAGIELKRQVLVRLAALDPEPEQLDEALEQIIHEMGRPHGPTRGVCLSVRSDWETACSSPHFIAWLLEQAIRDGMEPRRGRNRAD